MVKRILLHETRLSVIIGSDSLFAVFVLMELYAVVRQDVQTDGAYLPMNGSSSAL